MAIQNAGDMGVKLTERIGNAINNAVSKQMRKRIDTARSTENNTRNVKMGGKVTAAALSGTRAVAGAGASLASSATDKISEVFGKGIANNPVSKNMREAPEGTTKHTFYSNLMSGLMAVGRVYVEADKQGKIIIENAGDSAAELTGIKYGSEAEFATRQVAGITLHGYRIFRFPQKLGATSLLKGAFKSQVGNNGTAGPVPISAGQPYVSSGHGDGRPYVSPTSVDGSSNVPFGSRQ